MALTATIYNFDIDLADSDRGVYETLALRVAQHPSESDDYLMTRVIAYAMEYADGIEFSAGGLSNPDEPAITVRDLTGALRSWIEVGMPDADRLHRASKASPRVAVYVHRDPSQFLARLAGERIHRADAIEIYTVDVPLLNALGRPAAAADELQPFHLRPRTVRGPGVRQPDGCRSPSAPVIRVRVRTDP